MNSAQTLKEEFSKKLGFQAVASEDESDDSASTDEGAVQQGKQLSTYSTSTDYCHRMMELFQVKDGQAKYFELDSRVGLNGSKTCWSFPCVLDEETQRFFVWLGDITVDRFTKTTFLNLANFAESNGAKQMVLIQFRDHVQKGNILFLIISSPIPEAIQGPRRRARQQAGHERAHGQSQA
jgi:hypothetical protein